MSGSTASGTWRTAAALAACVTLAIAVYLPGLPGEYVYDDHRLIVDNDGLKRPFDASRAFLRDYYASDLDATGLGYYRPIAILSNELDYRAGGGRPLPFHRTNVLLHVAAVCCVFALARRLAPGRLVAPAFAAALFAVHPSHAESVAFISGRVDPLATMFVLWTVLLHLRANVAPRPGPWRVAAAGAWMCGLLSKEMAVSAPILALALEAGLEGWPRAGQWKARALRYVPYAVTAAAYLAARRAALGHLLMPSPEGATLSFAKPIVALGTYLRWLVLPPFGLNLEPEPTGGWWLAWASLTLLAAAVAAGALWRRRWLVELACLSAAGIALVPVLQLKPLETALSERFLYLPSAFVMVLFALLADRCRAGRARLAALALGVALACVYSAILVPRARLWRDEVRLWTAKDREDGGSLKARLNLGRAWHRRGEAASSRSAYEQAILLAPALAPQIRAEMSTLAGAGAAGDAVADVKRALDASPGDGSLWGNLGFLQLQRGDLDGAGEAFARATALSPLRATGWLGSALVKLRRDDLAGAEADASRASTLDPALGLARAIQGECLLKRGRPCEARAAVEGVRLDDPEELKILERVRFAAKAACPEPPI
jgi:tetratricopeptide (TPR) repeat protein